MPKIRKRKPWTKEMVKELKTYARRKVNARTIARHLKRTEGAVRQKAFSINLSLDTH